MERSKKLEEEWGFVLLCSEMHFVLQVRSEDNSTQEPKTISECLCYFCERFPRRFEVEEMKLLIQKYFYVVKTLWNFSYFMQYKKGEMRSCTRNSCNILQK